MSSYIQVLLTVNRFCTVYKAVRKYNHTDLLKDVYHDSVLRLRANVDFDPDSKSVAILAYKQDPSQHRPLTQEIPADYDFDTAVATLVDLDYKYIVLD